MFSGIVQDVGRVESREQRGGDVRLVIATTRLELAGVRVGDSVCVQGCCVTAVVVGQRSFAADLSRETLSLTTLGELAPGAPVNLETALKVGDALGGHLVSGHVDGVAEVTAVSDDARSRRLTIAAPPGLARFVAGKGSIALDGVSLTINAVQQASFGVNIIPHTLAHTTLGGLVPGARVNLEVDQVARYVARLLEVSAS